MAGKITLTWNPDPDPTVVGYNLHYGLASQLYTASLDAGSSTTAMVEALDPAVTYFFAVSAYNAAGVEGPLSREVVARVSSVPVILIQPSSQIVQAGGQVVLFVDAFGTAPISYQWYCGAAPLIGATNSILVLSQVSNASAGNYTVVVTGVGGSLASAVATVTVLNAMAGLSSVDGGMIAGIGSSFTTSDTAATANPPASMASVAGTYNGLFYETNTQGQPAISLQTTGFLSQCVVDYYGNFNGTIFLDGQSNSISGTFDSSGNASATAWNAGEGLFNLSVALHLDLGGSSEMTGTVSSLDPANSWSSALTAEPQTNSLLQSSDFILTLPMTGGVPGGSIVGMDTNGQFSLYGILGDGTKFTQGAPLSVSGDVPLFVQLNNSSGLIAGWINIFDNTPVQPVVWVQLSNEEQTGFTNVVEATLATFSEGGASSGSGGE